MIAAREICVGSTNLKKSLENKISLWAGELRENEKKIAEIQSLFETLPTHTARADRLKTVLQCAGEVMREIDPAWTDERVKPSKPFVHKSPVGLGQTAKRALDILREATEPMTAREIAKHVLDLEGVAEVGPKDLQRVTNSVDASLRQKEGRVVTHDGGWVKRWSVISPQLKGSIHRTNPDIR
jgi:hypothetical protein